LQTTKSSFGRSKLAALKIFHQFCKYIVKMMRIYRTVIRLLIYFYYRVVNNLSWYKELDLVHFISHFGRHFRIGQMLSRHSVQSRLTSEQGINFTEFSYQVFQAYDWLHLFQKYGCKFQVGLFQFFFLSFSILFLFHSRLEVMTKWETLSLAMN